MSSMTRVARRSASMVIRPAKRATASGSSAQAWTDSASERERGDGGLELVAHVRDEVAAYVVHAPGVGVVVDEDHERARRAERSDPGASRTSVPRRRGSSMSRSRI